MKIPKEFEDIFRGVDLTEDEIRTLHWLVGWERRTVENLRSAKDQAAVAALRAYAAVTDNAELAAAIINWVGAEPNDPLTLEQLREMEDPVWCVCKTVEGFEGFWCLCNHGYILTPARQIFDVKEIPHWVFYRRPPEGEEDT